MGLDRRFGEQRLRRDVAAGEVDVVEADGGAALGQLEADGAPQSGGAARHERDAAGQLFRATLGSGRSCVTAAPVGDGPCRAAMDQGEEAKSLEPIGQFEHLQVAAYLGAMPRFARGVLWVVVSLLGAAAFAVLALVRGETVSAAWVVVAAVCTYAVAYRFYSRFIATRVFGLDDRRATPAERLYNGRDFVPTNKWVLFGHHFAAIAGAGPLVGPVLAAQFGFLPGTLWLVIGVVLGGAVQDFTILFCSVRRDGKSLGPDGQGGDQPAGRLDRDGRGALHHDHPARRAGADRRQRAQGEPVGVVHHRLHDPHRAADGLVDEQLAAGTGGRGLGGGRRAAPRRAGGRGLGGEPPASGRRSRRRERR